LRKSLVLLGLVLVVFAAFVPVAASASAAVAVLPLIGLVVPVTAATIVRRIAARSDAQPVALLSITLFRAPPAR
jgi:hypothetical protein